MMSNNLIGMWKALQMSPTIEVLDDVVEMMTNLHCGSKDPLDFVGECKRNQERLHSSTQGKKMTSIPECIRHCVSRFPRESGWDLFKIQHNKEPAQKWGDLIDLVVTYQQVTGSAKLIAPEKDYDRQPPSYNRAFVADVEEE